MKKILWPTLLGCFFVFLYCLIFSSSSVWANYVETLIDPLLVIFYAILLAALVFNIINLRKFNLTQKMFTEHYMLVLKINLSTTFLWLGSFYGLKYMIPAIFTALLFGTLPLATSILTLGQPKSAPLRRAEFYFSCLIAFFLIVVAANDFINASNKTIAFLSCLLAIVCGFFSAYTNILSRRFAEYKYSASHVLSVRFYLILIIVFIILMHLNMSIKLSFTYFSYIGFVGLGLIILPLFFLQKGIERIDPVFVALMIPFVPVFTFFIQLLNPHYQFAWSDFIALVCLAAVIALATYVKTKLSQKL